MSSVNGQRRVLQVVLSLNPGGTERLVVEIAKRLQAEIPMAVCCLDDEGAWAGELKARDIPVNALHRANGFRPALGRAVANAARKHGALLIHCHHYSPFVYGCLARLWQPKCRVIFTEHGRLDDAPPSSKRRMANRTLKRMPEEVFAVSEDLRRHLIAEGFAQSSVEVIYNGIDVGRLPDTSDRRRIRRGLGVDDDVLMVGTIARLDRVKDLGTLIRATAALDPERRVVLIVVGDGPERTPLEKLAVDLTATHRVRFLGHRADARDLLAGCDVYANTSISEGISLTILEAMAAGLPVVATAVGGTPEIIDATCGRLVKAGDPAAVTTALRDLAIRPDVREALGRAARLRVEARFTLDRMIRAYRDAYYRVAA
jgi:glycosyltransferase involved in cell wall biosynthesis